MASHKITKLAGAKPTDEFELNVAQALVDLENNVADLKKDLRPLSITAAKEVRVIQPTLFHHHHYQHHTRPTPRARERMILIIN